MKLLTKLTLFVTLSKAAIVVLFVLLLPLLVSRVAFQYTNYYLQQQKKKVLKVIERDGLDYYFQGDSSYGSYTMLKEEYISLEPVSEMLPDTIQTTQRLIEGDTLTYRVLNHAFNYQGKKYMLEVGKTVATIEQYNRPLQRMALYILGALIVLTMVTDLVYTRLLLKPLNIIIRSKLENQHFPFRKNIEPIKTSTADFKYLDQSLINLMNKIHDDFERERAFTANASHELLTPVTILQTKMENLMMEDLDNAAQDKLVAMMKTLNRLKRIINSLLLISRIENEQFALTAQVHLPEVVQEVVEELQDRIAAREIMVNIHLEPVAPLQEVNRDLIFQLVFNIINNAIRYNRPEGSIIISGTSTKPGTYALAITDTGKGISPAAIPSLFDRFQRAGQTAGEGYGLGLSIVKAIAGYHHIKVTVDSVEGEGTTFTVYFNVR